MTKQIESSTDSTGMLEMKSLLLDIQVLQKNRVADQQEFHTFSEKVNQNFVNIQENRSEERRVGKECRL